MHLIQLHTNDTEHDYLHYLIRYKSPTKSTVVFHSTIVIQQHIQSVAVAPSICSSNSRCNSTVSMPYAIAFAPRRGLSYLNTALSNLIKVESICSSNAIYGDICNQPYHLHYWLVVAAVVINNVIMTSAVAVEKPL